MKDFAYWLRAGRERAGLTQAQLAAAISQSSSYVSMLESRRKPPPSDEVVRRIADALEIEEERLLEVAHIERTPPDIQRKILSLQGQVTRGKTLLERLLPAALYLSFASGRIDDRDALPVSKTTQTLLTRLDEHLSGCLADYDLFAEMAVSFYEGLGGADRELLLDLIGDLASGAIEGAPAPAAGAPAAEHRLPIFLDVPAGAVAESLDEVSGYQDVAAADAGPGCFGLFVHDNDCYPRIEQGDLVVVDETRAPSNGDLVAVLDRGSGALMRYLQLATHVELAPLSPQRPPVELHPHTPPEELAVRGVVIRVVRTLG